MTEPLGEIPQPEHEGNKQNDYPFRRKHIIQGDELDTFRQTHPGYEGANFVLTWLRPDGQRSWSMATGRNPDGSTRHLQLRDLPPSAFFVEPEGGNRSLTEQEALDLRPEFQLAKQAAVMKIDWERGREVPLIRDYMHAAHGVRRLQEDLINQDAPGATDDTDPTAEVDNIYPEYSCAELLLRAEASLLERSLPYTEGWDTWHHMAGKLDVAAKYFGLRVVAPTTPSPIQPPDGMWTNGEDQSYVPPTPNSGHDYEWWDGGSMAYASEAQKTLAVKEAKRLNIHPDLLELDQSLQRLLAHIGQAHELVEVTEHATNEPDVQGLTPPVHTRIKSALGLNRLVQGILESRLSHQPIDKETFRANLSSAIAPYGLSVEDPQANR